MRNFSIDLIWAKIQIAITAIGGWLGYFLGGIDGLMIALLIFMTLDYITGVMCAIVDKKLSSAVGFKGVCKKVLIWRRSRREPCRRGIHRQWSSASAFPEYGWRFSRFHRMPARSEYS